MFPGGHLDGRGDEALRCRFGVLRFHVQRLEVGCGLQFGHGGVGLGLASLHASAGQRVAVVGQTATV